MFRRKIDDRPLTVHVPSPREDSPAWKVVGGIAAAGLVVGVVWPRLLGSHAPPVVADAPSAAPSLAPSASAASSAAPSAVPSAEPRPTPSASSVASAVAPEVDAAVASAAPVASTSAPRPAATGGVAVSVERGVVISCRTAAGETLKGADCDRLQGLDNVIRPRLRRLAQCADAQEANGRLQFLLKLDLARGYLDPELARGQTFPSADLILGCAKSELNGAGITSVTHEHPRYSVTYAVTFGPRGTAPAPAPAPATESTGSETAQVVWDVAIIRDAPKTGKVVARLQRGSSVRLGPVRDGWYPVKYGDGFTADGWVYRGAIGR